MLMAVSFEQRDMHRLRIIFETTLFCHAYVNKRLRNKDEFHLLQNLHLYTQKFVCATSTRPFGEVGGNSLLQLSSQTHFAKIEDKNYCKNLVLLKL